MDSFLNETKALDNLFKHLKQMQNYLLDMKKLEFFNLPKPICLHNAYIINMHYLKDNWLDKFPSLQTVEEIIKNDKKLFFLPDEKKHYYLYYHLLISLKDFQELDGMQIYDDETSLDYDEISIFLTRNNLSACDFFMEYFLKGLNVNNENFVTFNNNKSIGYVSDDDNDDNITHEMSTEPSAPTLHLELEPEHKVEISKTVSPLSLVEELEIIDSPKKEVKENQIF